MRFTNVIGATAALLVAASTARAQPVTAPETARDKTAQATEAAKAGDYQRALALSKEARTLSDEPLYLCNVGIAYYNVRDWPHTHLLLAECLRHSGQLDAADVKRMGAAYDVAEKQLRKGPFGQLEVDSQPAGARITISTFGDEVVTAPRTVWLPRGSHQLTASKAGYDDASATVEIGANGSDTVTLILTEKPAPTTTVPADEAPPTGVKPVPPDEPAEPRRVAPAPAMRDPWKIPARVQRSYQSKRRRGRIALYIGGGALVSAALLHAVAFKIRRDGNDLPADDPRLDDKRRQWFYVGVPAYALYATAAASAVIGGVLLHKANREAEQSRKLRLTVGPKTIGLSGRF